MSLMSEFEGIKARLRGAVADAMENEVADAARSEISRQLAGYDFPWSRGVHGGGLSDPTRLKATVDAGGDEFVLTVTDTAPFQHPTGSNTTLAEVVTTGDETYHMPEPRPFLQPAERALIETGTAEDALRLGLARQGFETT